LIHNKPDRFERHLGISEKGYQRIWKECGTCGSATDIHRPEDLARLRELGTSYYEVDFAGSSLEEKYHKIMALPEARSDNAGRVGRVLAKIRGSVRDDSTPLRALDIGAGLGVFLSRLIELATSHGLRVDATAIEPDPKAARHLRNLGLFKVIEEILSEETQIANMGLISLNKVLEHVATPKTLLRNAISILEPTSGLLYFEVPDVMTIGNRPAKDNILGALHYHLYSPEGVCLLLRRIGLMPIEVSRVFEPSGKITVFAFAVFPQYIARLAAC